MSAFAERSQVYGSFELLVPEDERIFAYQRADSHLIVSNFSCGIVEYTHFQDLDRAMIMAETEPAAVKCVGRNIAIKPYAGAIFAL